MLPVLLIGLGGFIGAILRYFASGFVQIYFQDFPGGTFVVNFIGSFLLSLIMYGSEYKGFFSDHTRIFLTIGLLGSFTTLSTLNYETFKLIEQNQLDLALLNVFCNIFLGLGAIYLGRMIILR